MDLENLIAAQDDKSQLNIVIPKKILVQVDGVESYIKTLLVGMVPHHYLIMLSPKGNPSIKQKFFEGNTLLVRYFQEGTIFAFQSSILGTSLDPYAMIFLSYPKIVSNHELRKEKRASCQIPVTVGVNGREFGAVMLDVSKGGCRFAIMNTGLKGDPVEADTEIDLTFRLFDDRPDISCKGMVRSISLEEKVYIAGVQFLELPNEVLSTIDYFVDNTEMWTRVKNSLSHMRE